MKRSRNPDIQSWHVFSRGCRRLNLFYEDEDFLAFLGLVKKALDATGLSLWAYALMSNHYHFIIRGTAEQLERFMRWVNHSYSMYHNRKHGLTGTAFEGPYQAYLQRSRVLLLFKMAYVFLNPVDAHMVDRPEDYRWSSYKMFMGLPGTDLSVDPWPVLGLLSANPLEAREMFQVYMQRQARRPKRVPADRLSRMAVAQGQFEALLEEAQQRAQGLKREDPILVAMLWGQEVGIPPRAMRAVLGEAAPRYLAQTLYKYKKRVKGDARLADLLALP